MKRIVSFLLVAFMVVALCACNGNELQAKIEELETKFTAQTQATTELKEDLEAEIAELEEELAAQIQATTELEEELAAEIAELESKNENLEKELEKKSLGEFYSLERAYDNGFLTVEDLTEIANYRNNYLDYPEELLPSIEYVMKLAFSMENLKSFMITMAPNFIESITVKKYYGEYNGCYIVELETEYIFDFWLPEDEYEYVGEIGFRGAFASNVDVYKFD